MQELRILSGYHRGATLPLGEDTLTIGSDEDADVVLADPGMAGRHARLSRAAAGWLLEPLDGPVRGAASNAAQAQCLLKDGDFARAGAIWLTVCDNDTLWQNPPADPLDAMTDEPVESVAPAEENVSAEALAPEDAASADAVAAAVADQAGETSAPGPEMASNAGGKRASGVRMILVPVTAMAVVLSAAAYALTSHPEAPGEEIAAREAAQVRQLALQPQRLAPDQLQAAFRKRLVEIDLASRLNLDLQERRWSIRGALNEDESERLQRMLRIFSQRYVIDFPVEVSIGSAESMLPFRISQVISGNDPSIVTDDGRRLYVGDEYRGVRLAAVAGNQLRFTGKHNLDVTW